MINIVHGVPKGGSGQPALAIDVNTGKLYYSGGPVTGWTEITASADAGGVPADPSGSVQFNNSGAFGGSANLAFDPTAAPNGQLALGPIDADVGALATALSVNVSADGGTQFATLMSNIVYKGGDVDALPFNFYTITYNAGGATTGARVWYMDMEVYNGGSFANLTGIYAFGNAQDTSHVGNFIPFYSTFAKDTDASLDTYYGFYNAGLTPGSVGSATTMYAFWSASLAGMATNAYYFWGDSQGVYRIKEDASHNSIAQAVPAHYNPAFTKYVPGAVNFERITQYWDTNIAHFGVEKGGNGTVRDLKFIANRIFQAAPASAPSDGDLSASNISFYLDESGNNLKVRVKYANGTTLKTATVALA